MQLHASSSSARWFGNPLVRWIVLVVGAVATGALIFEALDISIFQRIGMPHEFCYLRDAKLVGLHVVSDILIGLAYVSISATLAYLVYRARKGIPFHWVFLAFGLFIVSCGMTHFMEVWVIWEPVYWMSGYVKVVTAAASVATAVVLFPLVPRVFQLVETARKSEVRRIEIEQLNQELERFNYSVAHDLRAPLRRITSFGSALREDFGPKLPPEANDYIHRMQKSATKMDELITDLLKYATIGRRELELRPIPLDDVLSASHTELETEIRERNAEVVSPEPLPVVIGDATMLHVVFQNLIGNAIKFVATDVKPRVEIRSKVESGFVTISVTDNGIGIPPGARSRVFGIFERLHPERSGTGIGLAIVHRAIERLHGKVGVEPSPHGTGTQFWFRLPVAQLGRS